ncbi:MAG: hemin uptake protein HemP [Methylovirgula sp.]
MADEKDRTPSSEELKRPPEIDVQELLGDAKEVTLLHGSERYRLRITANDKLILTK